MKKHIFIIMFVTFIVAISFFYIYKKTKNTSTTEDIVNTSTTEDIVTDSAITNVSKEDNKIKEQNKEDVQNFNTIIMKVPETIPLNEFFLSDCKPEGYSDFIEPVLALKMSLTDDDSYKYRVLIGGYNNSSKKETIKEFESLFYEINNKLKEKIDLNTVKLVETVGNSDYNNLFFFFSELSKEQIFSLAEKRIRCSYVGKGGNNVEYYNLETANAEELNRLCEWYGDQHIMDGENILLICSDISESEPVSVMREIKTNSPDHLIDGEVYRPKEIKNQIGSVLALKMSISEDERFNVVLKYKKQNNNAFSMDEIIEMFNKKNSENSIDKVYIIPVTKVTDSEGKAMNTTEEYKLAELTRIQIEVLAEMGIYVYYAGQGNIGLDLLDLEDNWWQTEKGIADFKKKHGESSVTLINLFCDQYGDGYIRNGWNVTHFR